MRRSDAKGFLQFGGFLALVAASGALAYQSLGTAWVLPAFLFYGTIFAFAEAASHELDHGTPFRSRWLNEVGAWIACFMMWREPVFGRYKHARHHTYTSIIGRDPEGAGFRSANLFDQALEMAIRYRHARLHMGATIRHAFGVISERDRDFYCIPENEYRRMGWNSRLLLLAYMAVIAWSAAAGSWLPIVFLLLPHSYGAWLHDLCSRAQHDGLATNVKDHRLTTRTMLLGPVLRFLYWNMNYHIEHHLYPNVPFHALPRLHEALKDQLPRPTNGIWGTWREILPALLKQRKNPNYHLKPILPVACSTA
jgi:fatty acid desaturase